jgi:hypothetical protein
VTTSWAPEQATCEACGAPLPPQPYAGNPRRFGCEACRAWRRRHPGETRDRNRCTSAPVDERPYYVVVREQMHRRADVNAARQGSNVDDEDRGKP